ncbi:MAG: T9SS type A sorting domain-containing protein [bacterium]
MKKVLITFLCLILVPLVSKSSYSAPEDFLGRVPIPMGTEVEVLKFKTDLIVYAGTNGAGLYVSYDAGTQWVKVSGFPEEFTCVKDLIITTTKEIYAATYGGGIYYSSDDGVTWSAKNNGITNLFIQAIAVTNDGLLVCGTYGSGIFYSVDKGENWIRTDNGLRYDNINCLEVMNNGYIVAGTYGGGFYVSRDNCKTWMPSNTQLNNLFINSLTKDLTGKLYAGTNGSGVVFSPDGIQWLTYGNQWHRGINNYTSPLLDTAVTCTASNQYQMFMGTRSTGFYFWDDLWNAWTSSGALYVGITACAVAPNGVILAARSYNDVTRSTDNGETWTICSKKLVDIDLEKWNNSPTFLSLYVSDFDNSIVSVMKKNVGGFTENAHRISRSFDHGNSWQYLNKITTYEISDIEITPDSSIYIADEDGIHKYSSLTRKFNLICTDPIEDDSLWRFLEIEYNPAAKTLFAIYKLLEPSNIPPPPDPTPKRLEYRLYQSMDLGKTWTYKSFGKRSISNINCEKNGDLYMKIDSNFSKSTDNGYSFSTLEVNKEKLIYGKDGNLYCWKGYHQIFMQKNKTGTWAQIPFYPRGMVLDSSWRIQALGATKDGNIYVSIQIEIADQGLMYEAYMTTDMGYSWQALKGYYNMDKIRSIKTDNDGYTYLLTNALYKVINPKDLKPPVIIDPLDKSIGANINPVFKWHRAHLAEEYEIQIDQSDKFYTPYESNLTGDTTCKVELDLSINRMYYWRIRSKTHSARSKWSVASFTVGLLPPKLISPVKGKIDIPRNADLKWHKIEDAIHYSIEVAEDETFDKIVFSTVNHPDTTITTSKLGGSKTFYWRVKAFTADNASGWSEIWNFRTVIGPPQLVYPEYKSIDKLLSEQFKWRKSPDTESYYLQIAKDTAFSDMFFEGDIGADTFKLIDNMSPETDYYWHVASVNYKGISDYSDSWAFRTSLKGVELSTPENEKVNVSINTKLNWSKHTGGSEYQIQISESADFETAFVDIKLNNLLEFQPDKLEYYKTYYWRVRIVIGTRVGLWSEIWSFKTGIETTALMNPPNKSVDRPTTIKFKWFEILGAEYYQLQISKNEQFKDMVYSTDSIIEAEQYIDDLEPETTYFWHVRGWNKESVGTLQWSPVWTFTTAKVSLILRNPKTRSTDLPIPLLLLWYVAVPPEYYHLQVASDKDFSNIVFEKDSIFDTKYWLTKSDVAVYSEYFWRVKGVSEHYTTAWSDVWQFTTGAVSVKECEQFSSIKLYPNPTGSKAELSINYEENCDATIFITTAEGKIIKSEPLRLLMGETRYEIDTEKLSSGSYYITIITSSGYVTRELVVIK